MPKLANVQMMKCLVTVRSSSKLLILLSIIDCLFYWNEERGSKEFERFLSILGNKIRLKGWDKYRGGLDVKGTQFFFFLFDIVALPLFHPSNHDVINVLCKYKVNVPGLQ